MYPFGPVRFESKYHCRFSTICLIFYDGFQVMFQNFWTQRDNKALWFISTCCLSTSVGFRHLLNTINISRYISFGNQEHFSFTLLLLFSKFISPQLFSFSSLRVCNGFTFHESCSFELLSLLKNRRPWNLCLYTECMIFCV
jgi:hypothetical protein